MAKQQVSTPHLDAMISFNEFEAIMNSIHDEILIADADGNVIFINEACLRIYNRTSKEFIGHNVRELEKHGIFSPSVTSVVLKTKKTESLIQTTQAGRKILVTATPIMDEHNEIIKVVCNSRDLTELINLRTELEEKENLLQQYTNHIKQITSQNAVEGIMYYSSPQMEKINQLIKKVAPSDISILLLGESGVGKTLIASIIHTLSNRQSGPFQVINCSAIPDTLLESELFGYEKGAFTGASNQGKLGLFELAHGGTIFLDEIGEISPQLQVKLLQVVQEKKFRKIGGTKQISADCRIITATNQDLNKRIKDKQFREDFYYRINGITINIPSLKERKDDIEVLAYRFLEDINEKYGQSKKLSRDVFYLFLEYDWPGNIRELKNLIERLHLVSENEVIELSDLPEHMLSHAKKTKKYSSRGDFGVLPLNKALEMLEEELLRAAYKKYKNTYKIAEALGISQPTAYRKLKKYFLDSDMN